MINNMIYDTNKDTLSGIIKLAGSGNLLIPAIQRDFVWTPSQIIRLIDSLLRGWPFGTLLLWDTGDHNNHNSLVPHHEFRRKVSGVTTNNCEIARLPGHALLPSANIPSNILMALDGQQRLQSLLLAFESHDAGLYLLDKDWWTGIDKTGDGNHPYRRNAKRNWMFGQLYLNLETLVRQVEPSQVSYGRPTLKSDIDYTKLFRWACPGNDQISDNSRSEEYKWPIDKLWEKNPEGGPNRYIHASLLWQKADGFGNLDGPSQERIISEILTDQHAGKWDEENKTKIYCGMLDLLNAFSRIKQQDCHYLLLKTAENAGYQFKPKVYSEAIVNIFTRLNWAGRALESEEITFAWIKKRWDELNREPPPAKSRPNGADITTELLKIFKQAATLKEEQAIRLLSHAWVTFSEAGKNREFRLLSAKDLLDGTEIQKIAEWLHENWDVVCDAIKQVCNTLVTLKFMYPYHFRSVNAIYALVIYSIGILKLLPNGGPINAGHNKIQEQFGPDILKWLGLTIFGGRWARKSDEDMELFVKTMGNAWLSAPQDAKQWRQAFINYVDVGTREKALNFVKRFEPDEESDSYISARPILALWNHCDQDRLTFCNNLSMLYQDDPPKFRGTIDHIVPQKPWEKSKFMKDDYQKCIHQLGNLMELDTSDNGAKHTKTLAKWLEKDKDKNTLKDLKRYFKIEDALSDGLLDSPENVDRIISAIKNRTETIIDEVAKFLQSFGGTDDGSGRLKKPDAPGSDARTDRK